MQQFISLSLRCSLFTFPFRNFMMCWMCTLHSETTVTLYLPVRANQTLVNHRKISWFRGVLRSETQRAERRSADRNIRFKICHTFNADSLAVSACLASLSHIYIRIVGRVAIHMSPTWGVQWSAYLAIAEATPTNCCTWEQGVQRRHCTCILPYCHTEFRSFLLSHLSVPSASSFVIIFSLLSFLTPFLSFYLLHTQQAVP
jgi:hypothetical protein